ncbi:MAG: short-chain fatty acyl-CoA regulator family protein, partial [Burkholderiaceae bacterium]
YVAGAVLLPYDDFLDAAVAARYDIDYLCHKFGASFEQVCHRLVTLKKPGREGIRFGFMRSDPAGYVTKRFPLPYMSLPRYGNACPLWAVYQAFQTPGAMIRQLAEFPTGDRYFFLARAVEKQLPSFSSAKHLMSIMLVCEAIHADQIVYGDGLDLSSAAPTTPVGPTCRLCVRRNCASREEDPIINA